MEENSCSLEVVAVEVVVRNVRKSQGMRERTHHKRFTLILLSPQGSRGRVAVVALGGHRSS
jgi:hypothetical protein